MFTSVGSEFREQEANRKHATIIVQMTLKGALGNNFIPPSSKA
jgi:hypothetical protein